MDGSYAFLIFAEIDQKFPTALALGHASTVTKC